MKESSRSLPLESLHAQVNEPLERARALPPWVYTDSQFLTLEQECIFSSSWICIGRADALPNKGDYLVTELAGEPIIVLRNGDDEISAMSNVCRHRMSTLLEGNGNVRLIVCPYHAWTYELDGRLRGAPAMEKSDAFESRSIRLPQVRCEVWLGWVFITLDAEAPRPSTALAELATLVEDYGMENYVESFREKFQWQANWKLVAENFMESYHLPICHKDTVGRQVELRELEVTEIREGFNFHRIVRGEKNGLTAAHESNSRLTGDLRRTTWVIAIYPALMITLTPGYFWYLTFAPNGTSRVDIVFGGGMSPEYADDEHAEHVFSQTRAVTSSILEEDRTCVERVYRGMQAALAKPGPLSHLEGGNHGFARWISSRISS